MSATHIISLPLSRSLVSYVYKIRYRVNRIRD